MFGSANHDDNAPKAARAGWRLFSSADAAGMDAESLDRASFRWQVMLVLLQAVLMIGGLARVHHLSDGKPSHPHSSDSVFAEMMEAEGEVHAEFVFLATAPDLVSPNLEVTSAPLENAPIGDSEFQTPTIVLLRGPPVA